MTASLVIVEGCDGSGKTTLINQLQEHLWFEEASVVHYGNVPNANASLPRFYLEGMLPAVNGYSPVILDRAWFSEEPYGYAYRQGKIRFNDFDSRMLERVALTCGAVVVFCDPGLEHCLEVFKGRLGDEYLDNEDQLREVYKRYFTRMGRSHLPVVHYDYQRNALSDILDVVQVFRQEYFNHAVAMPGVGSPTASVVLVGDSFANHTNQDAYQQFPFVSFGHGSSRWLAARLNEFAIPESELWWVNQDQLLEAIDLYEADAVTAIGEFFHDRHVVALGDVAHNTLGQTFGITHHVTHHPSYWQRFHKEPSAYPLLTLIKELLQP